MNAVEHYRLAEKYLAEAHKKAQQKSRGRVPGGLSASELRDEARLHKELADTLLMVQKFAGVLPGTFAEQWQDLIGGKEEKE